MEDLLEEVDLAEAVEEEVNPNIHSLKTSFKK